MHTPLTLTLSLALFFASYAQSDTLNKPITYTSVVWVDSTTEPNVLYERAKKWYGLEFKSGKDVIQLDDAQNFSISGRGYFDYYYYPMGVQQYSGKIYFDVNIYCKKGRYKYEFTNYRHEGNKIAQYPWPSWGLLTYNPESPDVDLMLVGRKGKNAIWEDMKYVVSENVKADIAKLKAHMEKPLPYQGSDW